MEHLTKLHRKEEGAIEAETPEITTAKSAKIGVDEVQQAFEELKNRKSRGPDGISNELLKYRKQYLAQQIIYNERYVQLS